MSATNHLARAKEYIARGDDYYAQAADEIIAAQSDDPTLSYSEIGRRIGKSKDWARLLVRARTSGDPDIQSTPFGGEERQARRDESSTRKVLRTAPEVIAQMADELHDDPKFQAAVASASSKISAKEDRRRVEREQVQRGIPADELAFERFKAESRAGNFGNADRLTDQFEVDDERAAWCRKYAERLRGLADWYDALADATPISDDELSQWLTNS